MRYGWLVLVVAWNLVGVVGAADLIKTVQGVSVTGKITEIKWDKVIIEAGLGEKTTTKEVPTNQITLILFENGSPLVKKPLNNAKAKIVTDRQYAEGLKLLAKIKRDDIDDDMQKQDVAYYTALANAKLALNGEGKLDEAAKAMQAFVKANPNSYRLLEASETLGDLYLAARSYRQAEEAYAKWAKAASPDAKMKAGVLVGRAQLAQKKYDEAMKSFESVLDMPGEGEAADRQRTTALLGKACVLVGQKKAKDAIKILNEIIENDESEDPELLARAYNARGTAYRQLGDLDGAKFDFLHTEKLYASVPEAHAEALFNLAQIWEQLGKVERAVEARKTLERLYKDSRWKGNDE
jgi:tetratricopeptide (TPR) repeat protein